MAQGFAYGNVSLYTNDTVRARRAEALQRRREVLERIRREEEAGELPPEQSMEETAQMIASVEETTPEMKETCCAPGPRKWAYKNLYGTSIAFMLVFSAFVGLQNLQSSLNETLGITSLSVTYAFYFLVGFITPGIVRLLGTKYALLFGFICHVIYIATNFYPEFYTLIPSSVLLGIGSGPVWAGLSTHLATTAITLAPHVNESIDILIAKFTGIFFFIFQLTQILGNVVSSLALFPYGSSNFTDLGDECDIVIDQEVTPEQTYILLSVYILFDLCGIAVLLIVVDRLPTDAMFMRDKNKVKRYCSEPFVDLLKVLFSWKMLLLGPLSFYNGLELAFAYSTFTEEFISRCVGVSWVGFTLIVLGFFSATMSFIYGKVVKYIPRVFLTTGAALINVFFLLFLQFFPLRPSYELIFLFAVGWGVADGVWNTMTSSLVGILFSNDQEAAYSAFRIWMSIGFAFGYAITELKSVDDRLWTIFAVLLFSFALYLVLEFFISKFGARYCGKEEMEADPDMMDKMLDGDIAELDNRSMSAAKRMLSRAVTVSEPVEGRVKYTLYEGSLDTGGTSMHGGGNELKGDPEQKEKGKKHHYKTVHF